MKNIDVTKPRWRYWVNKASEGIRCPRCGMTLELKHQAYMVLIKNLNEIKPIIYGTDGGHFCVSCPSIVLERMKFEHMIQLSVEGNECSYVIPGLIDMEAIPPEKKHIELGDDDNPIPLVEFKEPKKKSVASIGNSKRRKSKKRKRK